MVVSTSYKLPRLGERKSNEAIIRILYLYKVYDIDEYSSSIFMFRRDLICLPTYLGNSRVFLREMGRSFVVRT